MGTPIACFLAASDARLLMLLLYAAKLLSEFTSSFDATQQTELSELFSFTSVEGLLSSELVNKFR